MIRVKWSLGLDPKINGEEICLTNEAAEKFCKELYNCKMKLLNLKDADIYNTVKGNFSNKFAKHIKSSFDYKIFDKLQSIPLKITIDHI